jgi:hypothetical protein
MKIYIGPFKNWVGPYQIAEKIVFWDKDKAHSFGRFLSTGTTKKIESDKLFGDEPNYTWFHNVLQWIDGKKSRTVKIQIDDYDIWNTDVTLAVIILPMLIKIRDAKQGTPFIQDEDVPDELKSTNAPPKEHEWDWDNLNGDRWKWALDEMIWAFEQLQPDCDWEAQYHTGKIEFLKGSPDEHGNFPLLRGPGDTHRLDRDGLMAHSKRIDRGTNLFGKYFRSLWT